MNQNSIVVKIELTCCMIMMPNVSTASVHFLKIDFRASLLMIGCGESGLTCSFDADYLADCEI